MLNGRRLIGIVEMSVPSRRTAPRVGRTSPPISAEDRGLARAARPEHGHELAVAKAEVDIVQDLGAAVGLGDLAELDKRLRRAFHQVGSMPSCSAKSAGRGSARRQTSLRPP